jgi:hypothetical protein
MSGKNDVGALITVTLQETRVSLRIRVIAIGEGVRRSPSPWAPLQQHPLLGKSPMTEYIQLQGIKQKEISSCQSSTERSFLGLFGKRQGV